MDNQLIDLRIELPESSDIVADVSEIVSQSRRLAYAAVDVVLLQRNWLIGKRIAEEELKDSRKENYGLEIIETLSKELSKEFGKGFDKVNLYYYLRFFKAYPNIFYTASKQSFVSWSHYRLLLAIDDLKARQWYESEAIRCAWSVRTLQRNIETQYYYRIIASQIKEPVEEEMKAKTAEFQMDRLEHVKNPVILEFLGMSPDVSYLESDLESAIISNLQKMLMELGKGYAFVGRQYHIHTEARDYYIDLVFYNYILKCFVLIDLKAGRIEHQDVGQMDMYVRMFDELKKDKTDGPTMGIVLCSETDEDIARYSLLKGNEHLFATKYKLMLPSEEQLKAEIEHQKELFYLQHKKEGPDE